MPDVEAAIEAATNHFQRFIVELNDKSQRDFLRARLAAKAGHEEIVRSDTFQIGDQRFQFRVHEIRVILRDWLFDLASEGDRNADLILREAAVERLQHDEPLPPRLREYVESVLIGARGQRGSRGRIKRPARDLQIALAVDIVTEMGFSRTRNRATKDSESACSIVAKALAKVGISMDETAVEKARDHYAYLDQRPK